MSGRNQQGQSELRHHNRKPRFWSDIDIRLRALSWHRQMSVREAISRMHAEIGRAPSKSALARFWKRLDEQGGRPTLGAEVRAELLHDDSFVYAEAARAAAKRWAERRTAAREALRAELREEAKNRPAKSREDRVFEALRINPTCDDQERQSDRACLSCPYLRLSDPDSGFPVQWPMLGMRATLSGLLAAITARLRVVPGWWSMRGSAPSQQPQNSDHPSGETPPCDAEEGIHGPAAPESKKGGGK